MLTKLTKPVLSSPNQAKTLQSARKQFPIQTYSSYSSHLSRSSYSSYQSYPSFLSYRTQHPEYVEENWFQCHFCQKHLPSEKGLKYHQPFCKKNQFKTPKSKKVLSSNVHSSDVHSEDVHSPDVHSSDVHSSDVQSSTVHSPNVQCPLCQENIPSVELSNHTNERHFNQIDHSSFTNERHFNQISREGVKCDSCSLFFLNEAELSKHKCNCNHSSIIHHSPFIQIHQHKRHNRSNAKVENGEVNNLEVNGDLIDEEEDDKTTTLLNGEYSFNLS